MKEALRTPLLVRLMGRAEGRTLSRREYLDILAEDMAVLLNTCAPCRREKTDSVIEYGLVDWSTAAPDGLEVAGAVLTALERFEPRLKRIRVQSLGVEGCRLHLQVDATFETLPVAFLLRCDGGMFSTGLTAED